MGNGVAQSLNILLEHRREDETAMLRPVACEPILDEVTEGRNNCQAPRLAINFRATPRLKLVTQRKEGLVRRGLILRLLMAVAPLLCNVLATIAGRATQSAPCSFLMECRYSRSPYPALYSSSEPAAESATRSGNFWTGEPTADGGKDPGVGTQRGGPEGPILAAAVICAAAPHVDFLLWLGAGPAVVDPRRGVRAQPGSELLEVRARD
eukprot:CAMPEP_0175254608 /NCGR_PEP_ID=MMETSP0093-20121207/37277_1 /TAXON_ID=311494 /ORGANISM="Alexandrium monilatum, Strain CCMP3105" /LENGTH=208 /DNA_ID=CAMNT_0016548931 /DNA_START=152 /DNA_END=775 /DNA_ORIENTATION=-